MEEAKISLVVPGQPQGKLRPRAVRRRDHTRIYTPEKTVNYETYIKEMFVISYPDFVLLEGALRMTVTAWMMIPKSTSKKRAKLMVERVIRPDKKPDWDNIGKVASDALEGLAYKRDAQIVTGIVYKWYSHRPRLEIEITGAKI